MKNNASREKILGKISEISKNRVYNHEPNLYDNTAIYNAVLPDMVSCFKKELENINGKCFLSDDVKEQYSQIKTYLEQNIISEVFCMDKSIISHLKTYNIPFNNNLSNFESMQAGITQCEMLIARTGSVLVSSAGESGRMMNVFPPVHIVVANKSQLVEYLDESLVILQKKYKDSLPSAIQTITGPSRTADIEKTLVLGAHGPKEFVIFLRLN